MGTVPGEKKCRCCPYGFHIDLDFVNFTEDVVKGQSRSGRTPTLPRRDRNERNLQSPMESVFSDSLENIMSDFEEVLDRQYTSDIDGPATKERSGKGGYSNGYTNGYLSDFTGYRSQEKSDHFGQSDGEWKKPFQRKSNEKSAPPKPIQRPTNNGVRSQIQRSGSAYTALGRTINEIKHRQSMETLAERSESAASRTPSRLCGTPIDLGLTQRQPDRQTEQSFLLPKTAKDDFSSGVHPSWRRTHSASTERSFNTPSTEPNGEWSTTGRHDGFVSLRRGREDVQSDYEGAHQRIRYYSASPKVNRKIVVAPPLPRFSSDYSKNNDTTTSVNIGQEPERLRLKENISLPRETRSVGVTTGPIPPAKPCSECPNLKKQIDLLIENIPTIPEFSSVGVLTDEEPAKETKDSSNGETLERSNVGIGTELETKEKETQDEREFGKDTETQTSLVSTSDASISVRPRTYAIGMNTDQQIPKETNHFGVNTEGEFVPSEPSAPRPEREFCDGSTWTETVVTKDSGCGDPLKTIDRETNTIRVDCRSFDTQTRGVETRDSASSPIEAVEWRSSQSEGTTVSTGCDPIDFSASTSCDQNVQTDEQKATSAPTEPRVLTDSEIADSLWLMPEKEMIECGVGPDEEWIPNGELPKDCENCLKKEQIFMRNVGVGACCVSDKVCLICDRNVEIIDENEVPGFTPPDRIPDRSPLTISSATKKLLTSEQKENHFVRGSTLSKSCRLERTSSKEDSLEFIARQHRKANQKEHSSSPATTPSVDATEALKGKVELKKDVPLPPSKLPDPIPARIPRPKFSKYAPHNETAETPDEEDEASDRLTPLRSELRTLGRWGRSEGRIPYARQCDSEEEDEAVESDGSEGIYDCQENDESDLSPFEISAPFREALESLNSHLLQPGSVTAETADWALKYIQHEWLKTTARKNSQTVHVQIILDVLLELGPILTKTVVNITDQNGNTSLHYAVSHCNFAVVSSLLDCGQCQLNLPNKAGYTAVMLAALSNVENEVEKAVVHRLFQMGDVNARATQHGQTALMLAVSHGKKETTELLLETGADVNVQDEEGSTALMCAAEHGHRELVKRLLATPHIDASLTDCDSSTALSIAVENGHRDIGVLIYAHLNYSRQDSTEDIL